MQPIAAYLIGAYLAGLAGHDLLAVTVIAALPTAQNVFNFAMRYDRGVIWRGTRSSRPRCSRCR